jgi:hypothetical protein
MNRQQAIDYVKHCVDWIGPGFHPDTRFADYVDGAGRKLFNDDQVAIADANIEECFAVLGDEVYDIALDHSRAKFREPAQLQARDLVRWKKPQTEGEKRELHAVIEVNGDRCLIGCLNSGMTIAPTMTVRTADLLRVGRLPNDTSKETP